jgi:hypothetical protein
MSDPARFWGDKTPIMVPAWRDIATQSEFMQNLTPQQFPDKLPFYLFFACKDSSTIRHAKNSDAA